MNAEAIMPRPFRLDAIRRETGDTVTLLLEPVEGSRLDFNPGQYLMVYAFGVGEIPLSIAGGHLDDEPLMLTVRAVGAVTRALCGAAIGDIIGVRGPYGAGWPTVADCDLVVVAGGIGLAPLRTAVQAALARRDRLGNLSLLYGTRTPDDLLYRKELHTWRSRFDIEVEVTVDRAIGEWFGDVGLVTNLLKRIEFDPENTVALTCGPEVMMRVVARELGGYGVDPDRVHLSLERNMKCAIGLCGHCQLGPEFVCRDGPVFRFSRVGELMAVAEL